MKTLYKRLICCCVLMALVFIGAVSVGAERCSADTAYRAEVLSDNGEPGDSGKQIFVYIGGGVVGIVALICLLADKKKK